MSFCGNGCDLSGNAHRLREYVRALHCPTRWRMLRIIGEGEKATGDILEALRAGGESLARSSLYYHISELEKAGILELAGYREEGGGAPEKVWKLKVKEIKINLLGSSET